MDKLPPLMFEVRDNENCDEFFEIYGTGVISGQPWVVVIYKKSFYDWMSGKSTKDILWYLSENDRLFLDEGYAPECIELLRASEENLDCGKSLGCNTLDIEAKEYGKQIQVD
jgi:hypothetical protein